MANWTTEQVFLWILSTTAALWVGAFLKSYMSKKGENLATHEDIQKLVDQVKAVTEATKEIEAKISDAMWNRQKRWEIKKEAALAITRDLSILHDSLSGLAIAAKYINQQPDPKASHLITVRLEANDKWAAASIAFANSLAFAELAFDKEVTDALSEVNIVIRTIAGHVMKGDSGAFDKTLELSVKKMQGVNIAIRKELGIGGELVNRDNVPVGPVVE